MQNLSNPDNHIDGDFENAITAEGLSKTYQASGCLLYTSPSPRDGLLSRMPSSA